ncbi:MAG TPA: protein kinase, partial [Candidatus Eisenbacteria bacterium]|nr:protein kinase [Candidatus Eisenbacteria bacterium]
MAARSSDDWTGLRLLEHYTLTSFLGSGPIGSVYIGNDARTGRKVAVKVPHLRFLETAASRDEFQLSMRRFIPVAHPNLVRVLDTGAHMGVPFVVERFQLGGSLADRILERGGRLVPLEVMEWLPPIAKALDY